MLKKVLGLLCFCLSTHSLVAFSEEPRRSARPFAQGRGPHGPFLYLNGRIATEDGGNVMSFRKEPLQNIFRFLVLALVFGIALTSAYAKKGSGGKPPKPEVDPLIAFTEGFYTWGPLSGVDLNGNKKVLVNWQRVGRPVWIPGTSKVIFSTDESNPLGNGLYEVGVGESSVRKVLSTVITPLFDVQVIGGRPFAVYTLDGDPNNSDRFFFGDLFCPNPYIPDCQVSVSTAMSSTSFVAWSPDGTHLAIEGSTSTEGGGIFVFEVLFDGGGLPAGIDPASVREATGGMGGGAPDWSPDGKWLAFSFDQETYISNMHTLLDPYSPKVEQYNLTGRKDLDQRFSTWSPCSNQIVVEEHENQQSVGGSRSKLALLTISFDGNGNPRLVTRERLPSSRKDKFYNPDWKPEPCLP